MEISRCFNFLVGMSKYAFSCFPFGFEGRMWDLIVSVPDHCLSFYLCYVEGMKICSFIGYKCKSCIIVQLLGFKLVNEDYHRPNL